MTDPVDFAKGLATGILLVCVLLSAIIALARVAGERACVAENKAPACVREVEWVPVFKRSE